MLLFVAVDDNYIGSCSHSLNFGGDEMTEWQNECYTGVEMLRQAAEAMSIGCPMKKCRPYNNNDKRHKAKELAKRRKRNRNKKTHRK